MSYTEFFLPPPSSLTAAFGRRFGLIGKEPMRIRRRIAHVRRQVQQFAAIAAARAAQANGFRGDDRFRRLTEAEIEALLGSKLLARLAPRHPTHSGFDRSSTPSDTLS